MTDMPDDLDDLSNTQLWRLDREMTLLLKVEIARVARKDAKFRRLLKQALLVEEALEARTIVEADVVRAGKAVQAAISASQPPSGWFDPLTWDDYDEAGQGAFCAAAKAAVEAYGAPP